MSDAADALRYALTVVAPPEPEAPMCAVCGKLVDDFVWYDDLHVRHRYFVAKCHGKKQRVRVDFDTIKAATGIAFGLAFADGQRRIGTGP